MFGNPYFPIARRTRGAGRSRHRGTEEEGGAVLLDELSLLDGVDDHV